ncbi:MAG: hypothetical protein J5902_05440 [Paludibacteraceae bacterium]|nr:hypothetical protein [Paludibacteraceae bacterium]
MANEIEQRAITLPIASEGEKRKSTTDVTLAFKRILVVTSPQGTGGKGALIYIAGRKEPLQTAQTFSFKNWQDEIERKDEKYGYPIYRHNFLSVGPRMMVNMDVIDESYLDLSSNTLCLPHEGEKFPLDKTQIRLITERYAERDNRWFRKSFDNTLLEMRKRKEIKDSFDSTFGCLILILIVLIINMALLITILCIVA